MEALAAETVPSLAQGVRFDAQPRNEEVGNGRDGFR